MPNDDGRRERYRTIAPGWRRARADAPQTRCFRVFPVADFLFWDDIDKEIASFGPSQPTLMLRDQHPLTVLSPGRRRCAASGA